MNENNPLLETKEFKLLLNLLEKAEQIISIINLPDSSLSKYNTLKKITFDMLKINFIPLQKRIIKQNEFEDNMDNKNETLNILYMLNTQKLLLIELMLDYIKNNNSVTKGKKLDQFLGSLTEIYNLSKEAFTKKTEEEIFYEVNSETNKLSETFTRIDKIFLDNFDVNKQIRKNYENELNNLREKYDRDLDALKQSLGRNTFQKQDFESNKYNNNFKNSHYLNKLSCLIDESYEKYKRYYPFEEYENNRKYNWINNIENLKLDFIERVINLFFEKGCNTRSRGLELDNGCHSCMNCCNNKKLDDICSFLPKVQRESDIFHKKFCELMSYIETNVEGK